MIDREGTRIGKDDDALDELCELIPDKKCDDSLRNGEVGEAAVDRPRDVIADHEHLTLSMPWCQDVHQETSVEEKVSVGGIIRSETDQHPL